MSNLGPSCWHTARMSQSSPQEKTPAPQRKEHLDGLAYAVLLACCLFWGLQQVMAKATISEVPPVLQSAVRAVGATLLLMLWCRFRGIALFVRDGTLWLGLLAGAFFTFEFACIYLALQNTGASRVTVFLYTSPFWVAAFLPIFVRSERLSRLQWLGRFACSRRGAARRYIGFAGRCILGADHGGDSSHPALKCGRRAFAVLPIGQQRRGVAVGLADFG